MREYKIKRGLSADLERIKGILAREFPVEVKEDGEFLVLSYGALEELKVGIRDGKLVVESKPNAKATDDVILDTNKRFRRFLDEATGYTTKERKRMMSSDHSM